MTYERKRDKLSPCPVELVFEMVAGKWKVRVLHLLADRAHRFSELRRALAGVSQQVLAAQLAALQKDGLVEARGVVYRSQTASCYSLTTKGLSLLSVLNSVALWGAERLAENGEHWDAA